MEFMAIWRHDRFPYFLCGKVEKFIKEGRVQVEGYSTRQFEPVIILPLDWLDAIADSLEKLRDMRTQEELAMNKKLTKAAVQLLPKEIADAVGFVVKGEK